MHPTSPLFPSSMEQSSSCIYSRVLVIPWTQTKWHLCSILWSSPCWTLWSTPWGIKRSRVHSGKLLGEQSIHCTLSINYIFENVKLSLSLYYLRIF
jgi:hypothetical protein